MHRGVRSISTVIATAAALGAGGLVANTARTPVEHPCPPGAGCVDDPGTTIDVRVAPAETLRATVTGHGADVVFIPGLFGSAFSFRKVVAPLANAGYRTTVVEPLGIGASGRPKDADYSLEAQARRVGAVLDTLGIESPIVVAHAIGASIAFRLALRRPGAVRGIVSVEGGIAEAAGTPELRSTLGKASLLVMFGLEGVVTGKLRDRFVATSADSAWVTDSVMDGYLAPLRDESSVAIDAYRAMAEVTEPMRLAPRLHELDLPVVLLRGAASHPSSVPADELETMKSALRELRIVDVPGSGLWMQEEKPAAIVRAVRRLDRRRYWIGDARPDPR